MNRKLVAGLVAGTVLAMGSSVYAGSDAETTTAGNGEKKAEAIEKRIDKSNERHSERMKEWETKHTEKMAQIKEKLSSSKLSADAQAEILAFLETQYKENTEFRTSQHSELIALLESMKGNADLTKEQFKSTLQEFITKQKAENQAHRDEQKGERKAERERHRGDRKNGEKAAE